MKTASPASALPSLDLLSSKALAQLATVYDEESKAITLYFHQSTFPDKAHREEALTVEHLVKATQDAAQSGEVNSEGVAKDLARIIAMEAEFRSSPSRFKAIFACNDRQIWQEIDLPTCEDFSRLVISQRFQIVPLLRTMEACIPYCVVIIERGKARSFMVRGTQIIEMQPLPSENLAIDAEDSRVGWSRHIDGSVRERTKAYFKTLAHEVHGLLQDLSCHQLVVGCREDLWSELEPQFVRAGMKDMISGSFHLSSFDMAPHEIIQAAQPVVTDKQRQQHTQFWDAVRERPALSATGVESVLQSLESGCVQTLFLGELFGRDVRECGKCHQWLNTDNQCPACGSSLITTLPAEELLVRKALSTGAHIIAPDRATAALFSGVAAMLRY